MQVPRSHNTPLVHLQLLAASLQLEKLELEVRRLALLRQEEDLKLKLLTLEDDLLHTLAEAQGNILENKVRWERWYRTTTRY